MTIPVDQEGPPSGHGGQEPTRTDVRESIRYRRRAQDAEQRAAELESELERVRQEHEGEVEHLGGELAEARRRQERAEEESALLARDRRIERELIRLGARDPETALLVVRERLASACEAGAEADAAALAAQVLQEKPYLRGDGGEGEAVPALGRPSAGPRPSSVSSSRPRSGRLAAEARESGERGDLMRYMKARRAQRV
jgi:hypothetical protein